jgi:hypothetical protein
VITTLYFAEIERRYEKITAAHQRTFEWIFGSLSGDSEWTDFPSWILDRNSPLDWITGKAGAGKSTLMRFIYNHPRTKEALKVWAADRPLIAALFFFWNSGSEMHMSYEGLVRALLFQILNQVPSLVPILLPNRMEAGVVLGEQILHKDMGALPWTWEELLRTFRQLIKMCSEKYRMPFFIDGMDEFQGNPTELLDFVASPLTPETKVCTSSRP